MYSIDRPLRILMIDDWIDHRVIAERLLRESGVEYDFKFFISAVFAWDYLIELCLDPKACLPDLIFLDTILPSQSSWSFLSGLRKHRELHKMAVIMMQTTNLDLVYNYQTVEEAAYAKGANGFVQTPITQPKLISLVDNLLR